MLQIAKVLKSNGVEGDVLLGFRDIQPGELDIKEPVFIEFDGLPVPFFIESLSEKGMRAVVHLSGVSSLKDAEEIVGRAVFADMEFEEEDSMDFTGWKIFDSGNVFGTVTGMEDIPGNLCLYVERKGSEVMIPLHEDFIVSLDEDKMEMHLELPDGLAEL